MLTHLHIQNLAIIEEVELEFHPGMTVLTGETGAGKSILVDALGLILGDRGDSSIIRPDSDKSEIVATFDITENGEIFTLLDEQSISCDNQELIVRRIVSKDGRSKAYINSSLVSVQVLRKIGEVLVNIHGQHAHQSLSHRTNQRYLLDSFAGHKIIIDDINTICSEWKSIDEKLSSISSDSKSYDSTMELLGYQIKELEDLHLIVGEYDDLEEEYKRLSNISELIQISQKALHSLSEHEQSAESALQHTIHDFKDLQKSDPKLENFITLLENTSIQLTDTVDEIRQYSDNLETNPDRLNEVDNRLNLLMDIARKHQVHARDLPKQYEALSSRLNELKSNYDSINEMVERQKNILGKYEKLANKLHDSRVKNANNMSKAVTKHLSGLGMPEGNFIIDISSQEYDVPVKEGTDQVEFLISLNPGSKPQPMRKIASGGELSRISLAIQLVTKQMSLFTTMIFDEVDAGIGGKTADIVGELLKDLSEEHQVFCVTHLPQVASRANNHVQVSKSSNTNETHAQVKQLDQKERIEEIARMLGGIRISQKTLDHAKEMLAL